MQCVRCPLCIGLLPGCGNHGFGAGASPRVGLQRCYYGKYEPSRGQQTRIQGCDRATHVQLQGVGRLMGHRPAIVAVPGCQVSGEVGPTKLYDVPTVVLRCGTLFCRKPVQPSGARRRTKSIKEPTALLYLPPPWQEALPVQLFDANEAVPLIR